MWVERRNLLPNSHGIILIGNDEHVELWKLNSWPLNCQSVWLIAETAKFWNRNWTNLVILLHRPCSQWGRVIHSARQRRRFVPICYGRWTDQAREMKGDDKYGLYRAELGLTVGSWRIRAGVGRRNRLLELFWISTEMIVKRKLIEQLWHTFIKWYKKRIGKLDINIFTISHIFHTSDMTKNRTTNKYNFIIIIILIMQIICKNKMASISMPLKCWLELHHA